MDAIQIMENVLVNEANISLEQANIIANHILDALYDKEGLIVIKGDWA